MQPLPKPLPRSILLLLPVLLASCGEPLASDQFHAGLGASEPDQLGVLRFAEPVVVDNLTLWPVLAQETPELGRFPSLVDAEQRGLVTVQELGGGTVSQIQIRNDGKEPVLVCGGSLIKGGKQDRQIAHDLVVRAGDLITVDAYCVEQGRWDREREGRDTGGRFRCLPYLASKRVRASAQYDADQDQVWEQVEALNRKAGQDPGTGTYLAAVEDRGAARRRLEAELRLASALEARAAEHELIGFGYAINGEPLAVRIFANEEIFADHADPFLKTMVLEAELADRRSAEPYRRAAALLPLQSMLRRIDEAEWRPVYQEERVRRAQRTSRRGGHSKLEVLVRGPGGEQSWQILTEDWTAVVEIDAELHAELLEELGALCELGYTDAG